MEAWNEARYALRLMRKKPATTGVAVLSLAIGLGATATIFSFVNALLLRPLPVTQPDRLLEVWKRQDKPSSPMHSASTLNYPDFAYYRDRNSVFSGMAGFTGESQGVSWNRDGEGQALQYMLVSENFFQVTAVKPALGRFFSEAKEEPEAVLGYALWRQLGSDPSVIGQSWNLNGHLLRVIGVAPRNFNSLMPGFRTDLWVPFRNASLLGIALHENDRYASWLFGIGRLKEGVTAAQADADIRLLGRQLAEAFPEYNKDTGGITLPAQFIPGQFRKYVGGFTAILMAVMTLVLLIGCANAANILLAQASGRTRENAVRSALGASRGRLMGQTLIESMLLALLSGGAGFLVSALAAPLVLTLRPASLPVELDISPDWRVALFVLGFSLMTGFVFGLLPALRGSRPDLAQSMKSGGRGAVHGRSRARNALIVGQVAVCVVLLVAGGLCVRSFEAARNSTPGFNPEHVFVSTLKLGPFQYDEAKGLRFYRTLIERVGALPGVESVSLADHLPLSTTNNGESVEIAGKQVGHDAIDEMSVAPGFMRTLGTRLLRGRDFVWSDTATGPPVALINDEMAKRFWPGQDAVGKAIELGGRQVQVVGVVETGKYRSMGEGRVPFFYRPIAQSYWANAVVTVRIAGDPALFASSFRRIVQTLDPRLALFDSGTMRQQLEFALFTARVTGILLGTAGVLALVLAMAGLYGVIAYVVAQRTHEVGIRMALGAEGTDVLKMFLRQSLVLTGSGVILGIAMALGATRAIAGLLYGVGATDPLTFAAVAAGLMSLAAVATYVPARAAMRVNPVEALRYE